MVYFTVSQLKTFVAGINAVHNARLIGFQNNPLVICDASRTVAANGNETMVVRAYFDPVTRTIIT